MPAVKFNFKDDPSHREYTLVYDFNRFCDAEMETGQNLLSALGGSKNANQLRAMVYACLKTENPKVTLEEVGALLNRDTQLIVKALQAVLNAALPEDEGEDKQLGGEDIPAAA